MRLEGQLADWKSELLCRQPRVILRYSNNTWFGSIRDMVTYNLSLARAVGEKRGLCAGHGEEADVEHLACIRSRSDAPGALLVWVEFDKWQPFQDSLIPSHWTRQFLFGLGVHAQAPSTLAALFSLRSKQEADPDQVAT